jgi:hypothetical protein
MAAMRHRLGVDPRNHHHWPPTPSEIRNQIGGGCDGTDLFENELALKHLYEVDMLVRYGIPWDSFRSLIISGRGAVVQIKYSVIAPTRFDASPGFYGNHAIYVNERRSSDGAFLVGDPLADGRRAGIPEGYKWWPATLLRAAAYAMPGTSIGTVNASFTRDTER